MSEVKANHDGPVPRSALNDTAHADAIRSILQTGYPDYRWRVTVNQDRCWRIMVTQPVRRGTAWRTVYSYQDVPVFDEPLAPAQIANLIELHSLQLRMDIDGRLERMRLVGWHPVSRA